MHRIGTVNVFGEELKSSMTTSVFVFFGRAEPLVSESLPRTLVSRARPKTKASASVHVFRYLRNGETARSYLVVCFGR